MTMRVHRAHGYLCFPDIYRLPLPGRLYWEGMETEVATPAMARRTRDAVPAAKALEGEVVYLYAFDVANEIITRRVQEILSEKPFPFEIRMDRTLPKDMPLYKPLAIEPRPLST